MHFHPLAQQPSGLKLVVAFLVLFGFPVAIGGYLYYDARKRNASHPLAWALAAVVGGTLGAYFPMLVVPVVILSLYFLVREDLGAPAPPTFGEADMDESAQVLGEPLGGQEAEAEAETGGEEETGGRDEDLEPGGHPPEEAEEEGGESGEAGESGESGETGEGGESGESEEASDEEPTEEPADLSTDGDENEE